MSLSYGVSFHSVLFTFIWTFYLSVNLISFFDNFAFTNLENIYIKNFNDAVLFRFFLHLNFYQKNCAAEVQTRNYHVLDPWKHIREESFHSFLGLQSVIIHRGFLHHKTKEPLMHPAMISSISSPVPLAWPPVARIALSMWHLLSCRVTTDGLSTSTHHNSQRVSWYCWILPLFYFPWRWLVSRFWARGISVPKVLAAVGIVFLYSGCTKSH